jgi:hypothetical protein
VQGYKNISNVSFKSEVVSPTAPLGKPIEIVNKIIEKPLDILIPKPINEKARKKRKIAITVASSIAVLSGLVLFFNPKFSSKMLEKFKNLHKEAIENANKNKNSKILKFTAKFYEKMTKALEFTNNFNSVKDIGFKWLCTEEKQFLNVRNQTLRNILKKFDSGFRFLTTKPYNTITKWFDTIGKSTVRRKHSNVSKKLDSLELLIKNNKTKLSPEQQTRIDDLLKQITEARQYFSKTSLDERLAKQENLMCNLERDVLKHYRKYTKGFTNIGVDKSEHFNKNLSFWAQDIMMPTRKTLEKEGSEAVKKLFGADSQKGAYTEILELLSPHLDDSAKAQFKKAEIALKNANHSECIEYFDKKRDMILGSAPTDILTAIVGLSLSGVTLGKAENKDERISKTLTTALPVVAGLGTSIGLTAMLFSGTKGIMLGGLAGLGFNQIGQKVDNIRIANKKNKLANSQSNKENSSPEVKNA